MMYLTNMICYKSSASVPGCCSIYNRVYTNRILYQVFLNRSVVFLTRVPKAAQVSSWSVVVGTTRSVYLTSVKEFQKQIYCIYQKCSVSNKCEVFQKQHKCPGRSQSQARDSNERFRSVTTSGMEKKIFSSHSF